MRWRLQTRGGEPKVYTRVKRTDSREVLAGRTGLDGGDLVLTTCRERCGGDGLPRSALDVIWCVLQMWIQLAERPDLCARPGQVFVWTNGSC